MQQNLNIMLCAEEGAGLRALKMLAQSGQRVAMVLTSPPRAGSPIWIFAESHDIPVFPASAVKDPSFAHTVREAAIDVLLNVHSLHVVAPEVLEAPRLGAYNLHPGPLPRYAGLNAPAWAILRGEPSHGVTIHRMLAGIDTGAIAYQTMFDLHDGDTALSVGLKCVEEGLRLVSTLVGALSDDPRTVPRRAQDSSMREYFGRTIPDEGILRWDRSATEIGRFVRAFCYHPLSSPWGHPMTSLDGDAVAVVRATPTTQSAATAPGSVAITATGEAHVACIDAWLRLDLVKVGGLRVNPATWFRNGDRFGT